MDDAAVRVQISNVDGGRLDICGQGMLFEDDTVCGR